MSAEATAAKAEGRGSARERIFQTARDLFYRLGIRAVGVETIAAEAGTTKMSLYRHFASKDELVAECLREADREFFEWWDGVVASWPGQPRRQIEALFEAFEDRCSCEEHRRGCPIVNAAVEIVEDNHPALPIVQRHGLEIMRRLRAMCREMNARDPDRLATALTLLIGGGLIGRLVFRDPPPRKAVAEAARILIESPEIGAPPH